MLSRRHFLAGLIAAPAIVAASNIMPVRRVLWTPNTWYVRGAAYALGQIVGDTNGALNICIANGRSWETAFASLTEAFKGSEPGDAIYAAECLFEETVELPPDKRMHFENCKFKQAWLIAQPPLLSS